MIPNNIGTHISQKLLGYSAVVLVHIAELDTGLLLSVVSCSGDTTLTAPAEHLG